MGEMRAQESSYSGLVRSTYRIRSPKGAVGGNAEWDDSSMDWFVIVKAVPSRVSCLGRVMSIPKVLLTGLLLVWLKLL